MVMGIQPKMEMGIRPKFRERKNKLQVEIVISLVSIYFVVLLK